MSFISPADMELHTAQREQEGLHAVRFVEMIEIGEAIRH